MTGQQKWDSFLYRPPNKWVVIFVCIVLVIIALLAPWSDNGLYQQYKTIITADDATKAKLFFESCRNGQTEVVERYLAAGMDPNLPQEPYYNEISSKRALAFAIESDNFATCEALIAAGAKLHPCGGHLDAIGHAAAVNRPHMVDYFIVRAQLTDSPVALSKTLGRVLITAIVYGDNPDVVDYAISKGLDPNMPWMPNRSISIWAIEEARTHGSPEILKKLQRWQQTGQDTMVVRPQ